MEKHSGKLSRGCELCFKGKKSVLFVTGKCPRNCIYCPLSKEKKNNDVININELKSPSIKQIINEVKLSDSSGLGITGGDPLAVLPRTIKIISKLKRKFGKKFHIHLYTSLDLINEKTISKLRRAGLDELRVHPDIFNKTKWDKIKLLKNKFSEVGIEIPVLPREENKIFELIEFSKNCVDFYNLNQLEYATLHEKIYKAKKWKVRGDYSVDGSEKTAMKILKKYSRSKLRIHYCSSKFKDAVQFSNRIKVRAENVARAFDKITDDGLLFRGVIYPEKNSREIKNFIKKHKVKFAEEKKKKRILYDSDFARELSKHFSNVALIEEYPTTDGLEAEKEFLS